MDIADLGYRLAVIQPDGDRIYVDEYLETLTWEDFDDQLAMRLTAGAKNTKATKKRVAQLMPNGTEVRLYGGADRPFDELFRGRIFRNTTAWDGPSRTHEIVAYDPLFYLTGSSDDRYYPDGTTAKQVIRSIADDWGIPTGLLRGPDAKLGRMVFRDKTLAEQITSALRKAKERGDGKWIARMMMGKLETERYGRTRAPWRFEAEDIDQLTVDRSIEELVTKVEIVGREKGGSKILATATSPLLKQFGTIQQTLSRSDFNKAKGAERAAKQILKEQGVEKKERFFSAPDVPSLRRAEDIYIRAGTLEGFFTVKTVSHDARARRMFVVTEALPSETDIDINFDDVALYDWVPPDERVDGSVMKGDAAKALAIQANVLRGPSWVYDKALLAARRAGGGFSITSWRRTYDTIDGPGVSAHYAGGRALDIVASPMSKLDRLEAELNSLGPENRPDDVLWRVEGHYDHLHAEWDAA